MLYFVHRINERKQQMTTITRTRFESQCCTRCGGSGKFSFNLIHGDRCYGCKGTGEQLTKRGAAAKAKFTASMSHLASELEVGDSIYTNDHWYILQTIEADVLNPGMITLRMARITKEGRRTFAIKVYGNTPVTLVKSEAHLAQLMNEALAYQETLTKTGTVSKRKAKA